MASHGMQIFCNLLTTFWFVFHRTIEETMQLKDKHVLVIGSETPWLEAILLSKGAKKVTTLGTKTVLDYLTLLEKR